MESSCATSVTCCHMRRRATFVHCLFTVTREDWFVVDRLSKIEDRISGLFSTTCMGGRVPIGDDCFLVVGMKTAALGRLRPRWDSWRMADDVSMSKRVVGFGRGVSR
jgi:hypothetical protein